MTSVRYRCTDCTDDELPPHDEFVRVVAVASQHGHETPGAWWSPLASWPEVQAEAVAWLLNDGRCERHASLLAAMVVNGMQRMGLAATAPAVR